MVVGIGGVSRSGKTVLTSHIDSFLKDRGCKVLVLHQDELVVPKSSMPLIKGLLDWEHPSSIDFDKIISLVKENKNKYDYILIDGLFAFASEALNQYYEKGIYLSIDKETFIKRKLEDDRWGGSPHWYLNHIWDAHQIYGKPKNVNFPLLHLGGSDIDFKTAELYLQ